MSQRPDASVRSADIMPFPLTGRGRGPDNTGEPPGDDMGLHDYHGRISRLEGASTTLLASVAVVSAILIGVMGFLWVDVSRLEDSAARIENGLVRLEGQLSLISSNVTSSKDDISRLEQKIEALPAAIFQEIGSPDLGGGKLDLQHLVPYQLE